MFSHHEKHPVETHDPNGHFFVAVTESIMRKDTNSVTACVLECHEQYSVLLLEKKSSSRKNTTF